MSPLAIGIVMILILMLLMVLGVPVAFALGLTALLSVVLFLTTSELGYFADLVFESLNSFSMLAIPLFILMGSVFGQSKASKDLLQAAHAWLGRLKGGLAMSSVLACALFAALTGSSPATSAAVGRIAIPEMIKRGYPNGVATGAIAAGGTLGILIPPSVTLILYGVATEQSIGRLFLGGVGPGLLVTLLFCGWIFLTMSRHRTPQAAPATAGDNPGPAAPAATPDSAAPALPADVTDGWRQRVLLLVRVLPFVALMGAILVVLYAGVATPSEAAAVGALLSIAMVGLLYRTLTFRKIIDVTLEATGTSTMILMIVAFSAVLGQVMSFIGVPQELAETVAGLEVNRWVIFIAMNVLFLVLGFFIPPVAIILITMPILFPIITDLGFDPIWFGVIMTLNMEMGLITPPVGLNLYVVQGVAPEIPARDVLTGSLPYVGVLALGIVLLVFFPEIITWLPDQTFSESTSP